jgi:hypothetical protein
MFGADHLACTFVNLLGLKDVVRFVADDNPHKLGLFMPGSRLPIRGCRWSRWQRSRAPAPGWLLGRRPLRPR